MRKKGGVAYTSHSFCVSSAKYVFISFQTCKQSASLSHLPSERGRQRNDDEDVEDGASDDRPYADGLRLGGDDVVGERDEQLGGGRTSSHECGTGNVRAKKS